MRFGRTVLILLFIILVLSGALLALQYLRPEVPLLKGDRLFTFAPETILSITWDVKNEKDELIPLRLQREGEFWRIQHPYAGALCDQRKIVDFLDTVQGLSVISQIDAQASKTFHAERTLTLKTADSTYTCGIGTLSPMTLSQTLVKFNGHLVSVDATSIQKLPTTADEMRTRAILPIPESRILTLEWRAPNQPFARALRMATGNWNITRPFAFEAKANDVRTALEQLTSSSVIHHYVLPATTTELPNLTSEVELARYGLDEENAIRVSVHIRGLTENFTLRFGKEDASQKEHIFCLLDGYQAVVSVPQSIRAIFEQNGPLSTDFRNLPIFGETIRDVEYLTIHDTTSGPTIKVLHNASGWQLVSPMNLPADATRVQALLSTLATLTGDLIGNEPPEELPVVCELSYAPIAKADDSIMVTFYQYSSSELYAYRHDQARLYRHRADALPKALLAPNFEHTLVDRTVFSLPAATIRRIAVTRQNQSTEAIVRDEETAHWNTETPRGVYAKPDVVDAWLTCFADLKATRVLRDMPTAYGALRQYGLEQPRLTLTLDLKGGEEGLRRVLLLGEPDSKTKAIPAVVQGRPILYELDPSILTLLQQSLVQPEIPSE